MHETDQVHDFCSDKSKFSILMHCIIYQIEKKRNKEQKGIRKTSVCFQQSKLQGHTSHCNEPMSRVWPVITLFPQIKDHTGHP